jgi:hypothetical protein
MVRFGLASTERRLDGGVWTDVHTNYYNVAVFRKLAEHAYQSRARTACHRRRQAQGRVRGSPMGAAARAWTSRRRVSVRSDVRRRVVHEDDARRRPRRDILARGRTLLGRSRRGGRHPRRRGVAGAAFGIRRRERPRAGREDRSEPDAPSGELVGAAAKGATMPTASRRLSDGAPPIVGRSTASRRPLRARSSAVRTRRVRRSAVLRSGSSFPAPSCWPALLLAGCTPAHRPRHRRCRLRR